ncbi:hypothetical protein DBR27_17425 [Flavobacterium sp. HMWF030]|nr:hypothetical protein DBR27_17425 [Flavobacterium sp. HMWF030]
MNQKYFLILFTGITQLLSAQKITYKIPDSLRTKNYEYLDDKIYELKKDSSKAAVYMYAYLNKARNEHNWKEMVNAYQGLLHQSPDNLRLVYADSMIYSAKKSNDDALIGSAYLSKGIVYYGQKKQIMALDNYLIANSYISKTKDNYLIHKVKYHIALIKYYLGFYDEGISLLKECVAYFMEDENPRPYLNSLHSLGLCYNKIGNYELCSQTNSLGLSQSKRLGIKEMEAYFIHSEGINKYFMHNYRAAISDIEFTIEEISKNKDFANESIGNFYIGKSYWSLNNKEKAIPYFKKVDQIFNDKGYIRPDIRKAYELLIKYYGSIKDPKSQLYYIDQLLKAENVLNENFKYLIGKTHKEYDAKALLLERENIQEQLTRRKYYDSILVVFTLVLFIVVVVSTYRHYKNKTIYKQKFEELMSKINNEKPKHKNNTWEIADISPEVITDILKQLEKFEAEKKFLQKNISLAKLAVAFKSNTKYLSKIIMHSRGKGFVEYINDLKIDYIITLLHTDKAARKYTNKALAEEAGFTSTQRFANAFLARTEMPTAYFIEQLKKGES